MSLSTRGIARHFLNQTGTFPVRQVFFGGAAGTLRLRERLELIARQEMMFILSECVYAWVATYEQTWSHVRVRVQLIPVPGISAATMATLRTAWEQGIENKWNNRWGIGRPGEAPCPLTFDVQWVTSNMHHTVQVQVGPAPTNMGLWDTADNGDTAAHEFGHMHGNRDEYTNTLCPDRNPVNTGTVMDNNSDNVPQRLMQQLADNVGSNVV